MFEVGEKCVFIGSKLALNTLMTYPPDNSIVTISSYYGVKDGHAYYTLQGYEVTNGNKNYYAEVLLRKLDYDFVEEVIKQVKPEKIESC